MEFLYTFSPAQPDLELVAKFNRTTHYTTEFLSIKGYNSSLPASDFL